MFKNFVEGLGAVLELGAEIRASMDRLAAALEKHHGATPEPAVTNSDPTPAPATNTTPAPKKPGRPPKAAPAPATTGMPSGTADSPAPAATPVANSKPADPLDSMFAKSPADVPKEVTQDELRAALNRVIEKKGKDVARDIVVKVGNAQTFSLIVPEKYAAVVDACDEAVK